MDEFAVQSHVKATIAIQKKMFDEVNTTDSFTFVVLIGCQKGNFTFTSTNFQFQNWATHGGICQV